MMFDLRSRADDAHRDRLASDQEMALLRRYEPILRFTSGEQFFPVDVERYVEQASLWYQRPGEDPVCALTQGELTLETLGQVDLGRPDAVYFLKFADPLGVWELAKYRAEHPAASAGRRFSPGTGRLARVGYASRFFDAFFNVTLLARGRVPGDTAAAAALLFEQMLADGEQYRYHGRVVRESGWLVVQYWFFYVYNNWRSGFSGANDHEADWEMVSVYLAEPDDPATARANTNGDDFDSWLDGCRPEWVAYAAHDYEGDDLRRRWDDPEVEKLDGHPVVYVAAGSHACYFRRGEYLTELELPFLQPLTKAANRLQRFWHDQLRQYEGDGERASVDERGNLFRIPFVDYARGDGLTLGCGQGKQWSAPRLLDTDEGWLSAYRGLWGLYAQDPFAGENAPAGPMYNQNRTMRRSWFDPVGWSGLDKVSPAYEETRLIVAQQVELRQLERQLQGEIQEKAFELRNLGIATRAMRTQPHLQRLHADYQGKVETLSEELARLRTDLAARRALLHTLDGYAALLAAGVREPPRAHIRRALTPAMGEPFRAGRLAEIWAAASIGLMLVVLVGLIYFARHFMVFGLSAMIALFAFIEATFRGRLVRMVTSMTIGLAVVAALVLVYEFFWSIVALIVFVIGSYLLWDNLRELWR